MSPQPGDLVFLGLRFFDGYGKKVEEWLDSLGLEEKVRTHVTQARCTKWAAGQKKLQARLPVSSLDVTLSMFDITACVYTPDVVNEDEFVVVDAAFVTRHPAVLSLGDH